MKRKLLSVILSSALIISMFNVIGIHAFAGSNLNDDFSLLEGSQSGIEISGDKTKGFTTTVTGGNTGLTELQTNNSYPLKTISFDTSAQFVGAQYGYGLFGISKTVSDKNSETPSSENQLNFRYYSGYSNGLMLIEINTDKNIWTNVATLSSADRGDAYWYPNVSNFSFTKESNHWYLTVDGKVCTGFALDSIWGNSVFDNNENVYIQFGLRNNLGSSSSESTKDYSFYFKQMSSEISDGLWNCYSSNHYSFNYAGTNYEYRGQGITDSTKFGASPSFVSGNKNDGHIFDFTNSDGYVQTSSGIDLKNTVISYSIFKDNMADLDNVFDSYIALTTNPNNLKDHTLNSNSIIEYNFTSVSPYSQNQTYFYKIISDLFDSPKLSQMIEASYTLHRDSTNYADAAATISFVQDTGADGQIHWYTKVSIYGNAKVLKSSDSDFDATLRLDSIIDKPVYFRAGTKANSSFNAKMFCKLSSWPDVSDKLPTISASQENMINSIKSELETMPEELSNTYFEDNYTELTELIENYNNLTDDAKSYLTDDQINKINSIIKLSKDYGVSSLFNITAENKDVTSVTGDKDVGYKALIKGSGRTTLMSKAVLPLASLSFDYGINHGGNNAGEFGISVDGNVGDISKSNNNSLVFEYVISNKTINIYFLSNDGNILIGSFTGDGVNRGDAYWADNVSNFGFVNKDGHWYLCVDGNICDKTDYSMLDKTIGRSIFNNNDKVHLFFGAYINSLKDDGYTAYMRQLSCNSEDGLWTSVATDHYQYQGQEYRGVGLLDLDNSVIHSKIPKAATGDITNGHTVDFTGSNGYVQSTQGFNLKTTTFTVKPAASCPLQSPYAPLYYLGFTTNPNQLKDHAISENRATEIKEFSLQSVSWQSATWIRPFLSTSSGIPDTNTVTGINTPTVFSKEDSTTFLISFKELTGADGNSHWYMVMTVNNVENVVKSDDNSVDEKLRFDNIINKPVFFRAGTQGNDPATEFTHFYVKVNGWQENGEQLPTISAKEEENVDICNNLNSILNNLNDTNITDNAENVNLFRDAYDTLSDNAKKYISTSCDDIYKNIVSLTPKYDFVRDYVFNQSDVLYVKKLIFNKQAKTEMDLNNDGSYNIFDVVLLQIELEK